MSLKIRKPDGKKVKCCVSDIQGALNAQARALQMLDNEETFGTLLRSYFEVERLALETSLRRQLNSSIEIRQSHEITASFNFVMCAVLFAARGYVDKTRASLSRNFIELPEILASFDTSRKSEHSKHLSFRFFEALRNYAQHVGTPVTGYTIFTCPSAEGQWTSCGITVDRSDILDQEEFRKVRTEVSKMTGHIQLIPMLREYISAFARVQAKLRESLEQTHQDVRGAMFKVFIAANELGDELTVIEVDDAGRVSKHSFLALSPLHRISRLIAENENSSLGSLRVRTQAPLNVPKGMANV